MAPGRGVGRKGGECFQNISIFINWKTKFCKNDKFLVVHRRRQEFYFDYFDFWWGTLISFPASVNKFIILPLQFSNFGEGTFPLFPHPDSAYLVFVLHETLSGNINGKRSRLRGMEV